jgi:hypothetical protein
MCQLPVVLGGGNPVPYFYQRFEKRKMNRRKELDFQSSN